MSKYFDQTNMFMEPEVKQHGSHMVMTNVVKPTKTKYLTLDTRFRDGYDFNTNANYNITLPERVNNVRSMQLRNIEIPVTYYNISCALGNNKFTIKILQNEKEFVVPDGQYTQDELKTAINNLLSNAGTPHSTITVSIQNRKWRFENTGNNPCTITFDKPEYTFTNGVKVEKEDTPNADQMSRLGWKLGYRKKKYVVDSTNAEEGESFIDINGPRYLYLIVDEFTNGNPHSFLGVSKTSQLSSQQILARIAIDYNNFPFGSIIPAEKDNYALSDTRRYANEVDLQRMNIRLVDEFGKIMNLNGTDISLCLELEHL